MIETNDDFAKFFDDFAVDIVWNSVIFKGIFDNDYYDAEVGGSVAFATSQPRLTVPTFRINGMTEGANITIDGDAYIVRVIMNDGTGVSVLICEG